jgi:rod shape-determining protein MreC
VSTVVVYRQSRRRRVTLVLLVLTSLALMSLDERGSSLITSARTAAQDVVSPVQTLADDVFNPVSEWFDSLGRANELQDENTRLREQLDAAKSEIAAAAGSLAELKTLRGILDLPTIEDADAVTAEVITQGGGNFERSFRISKGSDSGIVRNMPVVVGAAGKAALVGRIASVSKSSAVVERIDDRSFGAGAQLVSGGAFGPKGTAEGQGNSSLLRFSVIDDTGTSVTMKKGDVAVTLGSLFEPYPQGLVIGSVVHEVGAGGAIARDAELRPVVDLDSLNLVKVLKYVPATIP